MNLPFAFATHLALFCCWAAASGHGAGGGCFSTAPFVGALFAVLFLAHRPAGKPVDGHHAHPHTSALEGEHAHRHAHDPDADCPDAHHRHEH